MTSVRPELAERRRLAAMVDALSLLFIQLEAPSTIRYAASACPLQALSSPPRSGWRRRFEGYDRALHTTRQVFHDPAEAAFRPTNNGSRFEGTRAAFWEGR